MFAIKKLNYVLLTLILCICIPKFGWSQDKESKPAPDYPKVDWQRQDFSEFKAQDFTAEIASAVANIDQVANKGPFKPEWESLEKYEIPEWYKDAKFGIFIHWGVYSVPEFGWEWYPRALYIDRDEWRGNSFKHHLKTYGNQSEFGYKDFIAGLKAEKFDATQWAKLFKRAGARYVVPVAEHHDGFPMYDCSFTQWSSVKMGPKRDIVKELSTAVRDQDMKFGVSSHRAFNWLYYVRNENFDNADPRFAGLYGRSMPELYKPEAWNYRKNWVPQDQAFKDEWLARNCELVDLYQPDLFWFDFGIYHNQKGSPYDNDFGDHLKQFASYYYNKGPDQNRDSVLNYKWNAFPEKAAVLDLERSKLDTIRDLFWQTDTSVATNSWSFIQGIKYRPVDSLIDDLVDIVSKNGCLLLNVCPRSDGTIPQQQQAILTEIGDWLAINGEAIYETRTFKIFGEGPTITATGHVSEKKNKPFGDKDVRFTTKGDTLFAIALGIPESKIVTVVSLKSGNTLKEFTSVKMLGSDVEVAWEQTEKGLEIKLPESLPSQHAIVFKIQ